MSILATIARIVERRRREARTRFELESLSDRELDDLGIARADIARLARESARMEPFDIHTWRRGDVAADARLAPHGI